MRVTRVSLEVSFKHLTNAFAELFGYFFQVASTLFDSIRDKISWYDTWPKARFGLIAKDLFDTFTRSLWNTVFKIGFIASSAYILYLMVNEYRPTQDPSLDTFKVEYLLGGAAVLGILFPSKYTFKEVRDYPYCSIKAECF
jgi:hypothetical protein